MPKVAIGCPVRNRAWILPEYLAALDKIDYPQVQFLFLENDSDDDTRWILDDWTFSRNDYADFICWRTGAEAWERGDYSLNGYANLATVRNQFVKSILEYTDADYLFSVDSDVIVPPDALQRLLEHADENTIVGAAISNIPGQPLDGSTPGNFMIERNGMMVHPNPYPLSGLLDVDVIGAVYLIPRKALESGVRYAAHPQGEDIAFCIKAAEMGFQMRVVTDVKCEHRMTKGVV